MSLSAAGVAKTWSAPRTTAAADTAWTFLVRPKGKGCRTKVTQAKYTSLGTAHTLTFLTPMAKTTVYAAAIAGATTLVLSRDPGLYAANAIADGVSPPNVPSVANNAVAANDYLVVQQPDGVFLLLKPSAVGAGTVTGTVNLTVTALPTGGIAAGAPVWFLGAPGDTNPRTGRAHDAYSPTVSTATTYGDNTGEIAGTPSENEPLLIHSNNITAAGILEYASGSYGP